MNEPVDQMSLASRIAFYVYLHPGVTQAGLTEVFIVESRTYGRQRAVTAAVVDLRARGWLQDIEPLYTSQSFNDTVQRLTREDHAG